MRQVHGLLIFHRRHRVLPTYLPQIVTHDITSKVKYRQSQNLILVEQRLAPLTITLIFKRKINQSGK